MRLTASLLAAALVAGALLLPARTTTAEPASVAAPPDPAQVEQNRNRPEQEERLAYAAAISQTAYLKASNAEAGNHFGTSVAVDGDTSVVGMYGGAYVYTRSVDGTWTQAAYLQASNAETSDEFGNSVAISGDTIVVGARLEDGSITSTLGSPNNDAVNAGAAYVYTRSVAGTWTQAAYLKASNAMEDDQFGISVALSGDTIVVGTCSSWSIISGGAYVYTRNVAGMWTQAAYLQASNADAEDCFGGSVALSGDTMVVGAYNEDGSITSTMGSPNNAASDAGAAYVYTRSVAGTWTQAAYLKASNAEENDDFGWSVALSGDTIVVGADEESGSITSTLGSENNEASSAGAVYVYTRSVAGMWTQAAYLKASNADAYDYFGDSVTLSGDTIVVGAPYEAGSITSTMGSENNEAFRVGAAYVYTRSVAGMWMPAAYLKAWNAEERDEFGTSVVIAGDTIVVGASEEAGSITSTMGSENNEAPGAGAVYVFRILSTDASLSGLALSAGALTPEFVNTTTSYAANVANETASIVVTPTTNHASATYTVSNAAGACAVDACALDVGDNTITITVTAENDVSTQNYTVVVTRADAPTPTPTPTPGGPPATPTAVPPSPTPIPEDPYVSPSYGPPTTSTVSIISPAGGLRGATRVSVNGVRMFHVVRNDRKIDFTMKAVVAVAGTTVDVVLVKADDTVMTFTQSFTFEEPTTVTGTTASGAVLTTTTGVTVTVPPQTSLRPAAPQIAGSIVITYAQVDTPAEPPGDVPLSFFDVSVSIDGSLVPTLTHPAIFELPVDAAMVPPGQRPWLYEWVAVGGTWSLVANQTYDPATGLVTAPTNRLGIYVLVTAAMRWNYLPQVGNIYAPLDSMR